MSVACKHDDEIDAEAVGACNDRLESDIATISVV